MSESDDWENQLDSDNEKEEQKKKEEEEAKKKAFEDEDKVDTEKLKKEKAEEAKRIAREAQENGRVKSTNKVDYDKIFNERQAKLSGEPVAAVTETKDTKGMSKAAKGMIMEQNAESNLVNQLFGGDDAEDTKKVSLASEKEYKEFATKVAEQLYQGSAPYRIEAFFRELSKDLPKHADSKQINTIAVHFKTMHNQKLKDEKAGDKNVKKKAPTLKGATSKAYELNNNKAMINDVMGDAGDEYGDYGEEGFTKEAEGEYDFM